MKVHPSILGRFFANVIQFSWVFIYLILDGLFMCVCMCCACELKKTGESEKLFRSANVRDKYTMCTNLVVVIHPKAKKGKTIFSYYQCSSVGLCLINIFLSSVNRVCFPNNPSGTDIKVSCFLYDLIHFININPFEISSFKTDCWDHFSDSILVFYLWSQFYTICLRHGWCGCQETVLIEKLILGYNAATCNLCLAKGMSFSNFNPCVNQSEMIHH